MDNVLSGNKENQITGNICLYCQEGKSLNYSNFGDTTIKTYIHGNLLITEAYDNNYDEDDYSAMRIKVCPVCKSEVHELEDEEIEEELDES